MRDLTQAACVITTFVIIMYGVTTLSNYFAKRNVDNNIDIIATVLTKELNKDPNPIHPLTVEKVRAILEEK